MISANVVVFATSIPLR